MHLRWWPAHRDPRVASTRIRCLRLIDGLRQLGVDAALHDPVAPAPEILILGKRYDAASIAAARSLRVQGTRVVLDLCDNHFYAENPSPASERRKANLIDAIRSVDAVVVATAALAEVVADQCRSSPSLTVIGDAFEPPADPTSFAALSHPAHEWLFGRFARALARGSTPKIRLVWFGHHGNEFAGGGMHDLMRIAPQLESLSSHLPLSLSIISNHAGKFRRLRKQMNFTCHYLPWNASNFSRAMRLHDVALIPVSLNPFTACKTNNRIATALVHGVAVVADPVPSYLEFSDSAILGDWEGGLQRLCTDSEWRQQRVRVGRERLENRWALRTISAQWLTLLRGVAEK